MYGKRGVFVQTDVETSWSLRAIMHQEEQLYTVSDSSVCILTCAPIAQSMAAMMQFCQHVINKAFPIPVTSIFKSTPEIGPEFDTFQMKHTYFPSN